MNHSLVIEEVLAHPQDVSWLPWAVQYFFFIGIAACAALFACVLHWRKQEIPEAGKSDAVNRPDLRDYRAAGADR